MKSLALLLLILSTLRCTNPKPIKEQEAVPDHTAQTKPAVLYFLPKGSNSWQPFSKGIPENATVSSLLEDQNQIIATTISHGIYLLRSGETTWKRIDAGFPGDVKINAIASTGNGYFIGTHHGILISINNGKNWSDVKNPAWASIRAFHSTKDLLLAGGDDGIYKSTDQGKFWSLVYKESQANGFTALNGKIYAALSNGAVISEDSGDSWKRIYSASTLHDISSDGESIYGMTLGEGLLKSNDEGKNWININKGLGTLNLYTFETRKVDNRLMAAQWYGIYVSESGGIDWHLMKNGLPDSTSFTTLEHFERGVIAGIGSRK